MIYLVTVLGGVFDENERRLAEISTEIEELHRRMDLYLTFIRSASEGYRTCSAT